MRYGVVKVVTSEISEKMQPESLDQLRLGLITALILISAGSLILKTAKGPTATYENA